MWKWLVNKLIARAKRTPYFHLYHENGELYMERYWLVPYKWNWPFAARLHFIATPDRGRHLHDHPWSFLSVVLRGWYTEERPRTIQPCFEKEQWYEQRYEATTSVVRDEKSWAFRRATDRHTISAIGAHGVWTLFVTFRFVQWWGFYTPRGKVYYRDYLNLGDKDNA